METEANSNPSALKKSDVVVIRDFVFNDTNFIFSSFLKGLRYGNDWFELIDKDTYFREYHKVLEAILDDPRTMVKVACLKLDPDVIIGFSIYTGTTLHWVFCKNRWRKIGLAKDLVPGNIESVTHVTKIGASLLRKYPQVRFNPFNPLR